MFDTEVPFDLLPPEEASEPALESASDDLVADLHWLPPGVMLAAALDRVDRKRLSGSDRVELLKARSRMIAHLQAELHADVEAIGDAFRAEDWVEDELEVFGSTALEVSAALSMTRRAAEALTGQAMTLLRLPRVWEALDDGAIDLPRARIISDLTSHLPLEEAARVADSALEHASHRTTGQLRARLSRLVISIDPAAAKERYETKLAERRVHCRPAEDGTAHLLGLNLPPDQANAAMRRLSRLAMKLKAKGDKRPIDQIRADLYLAILTGRHDAEGESHTAGIDLRVDLTTLAGLDDNPADIPGWGPVIADIARKVAMDQAKGPWQATVTDDNSGLPVSAVSTRRRPTASQQRVVAAICPECAFPTCRQPSAECDINHEVPWVEAHRTTVDELGPLCRHHHVAHHRKGWKLKRISPGVYQWTSPLGHTYTNGPDPP
jgi:hypothetical protein